MPLHDVEYDCLCCGGHFIKKGVHHCPIGFCTRYAHYDFCETCRRLSTNSFEAQMAPKPHLRIEGETE